MPDTMRRCACCTAVSLAAASCAIGATTSDDQAVDRLGRLPLVGTQVLAQMRGGFTGMSGGLPFELSFGIEQALFVNDALMVSTKLTVPSITQPSQASLTTVVAPTPPSVTAPTAPTIAP